MSTVPPGPTPEQRPVPRADVEVFDFQDRQPVRTVVVDGEPWFVATDACAVLALANPRTSLALLDDDEKGVHTMDTPGGRQDVTIVNEPGLYSLILRSRKPEAKAFKRWITHDVLPALRRTGRYEVAPRELTRLELIDLAREAEVGRLAAEKRAAELEPSATAWDRLASATGDYSVRQAAFILNRDPKISTGQNRLFKTLRQFGMVDANDVPYATHAEHVRLRPRAYDSPVTGEPKTSDQVRVTVAGLRYLHRRMGGIAPLRFDGPEQPDLFEDGAA